MTSITYAICITTILFTIAALGGACIAGQFDCTGTGNGNGTSCINAALVCNNNIDCPIGGLDENTAIVCGCTRGNNNCLCIIGPGNEIICGCAFGTVPSNRKCITSPPATRPKGKSKGIGRGKGYRTGKNGPGKRVAMKNEHALTDE